MSEANLDEMCTCGHVAEYHSGGYGDCMTSSGCDCRGFDSGEVTPPSPPEIDRERNTMNKPATPPEVQRPTRYEPNGQPWRRPVYTCSEADALFESLEAQLAAANQRADEAFNDGVEAQRKAVAFMMAGSTLRGMSYSEMGNAILDVNVKRPTPSPATGGTE